MESRKARAAQRAAELKALYDEHGSLDPAVLVSWAAEHPESATHAALEWDDTVAGHQYRLWQARTIITEVRVTYEDGRTEQVYVSPVESRGKGGYSALAEVMSDAERKKAFLAQALEEYQRVGEKYSRLKELAAVRAAVQRAVNKTRPAARKMARAA